MEEKSKKRTEERNAPKTSAGAGQKVEAEESLIERIGKGIRKARITETIASEMEATGQAIKSLMTGRENVLMVRVNRKTMDKIDSLVDAGMVRSRSEGAAFLIAVGISSQVELFGLIDKKITQIRKIRDELKEMVKEKVEEYAVDVSDEKAQAKISDQETN